MFDSAALAAIRLCHLFYCGDSVLENGQDLLIKLHLTIVVKLRVARYQIIGPMAQSSTGSKAFEVEDDADVEIAGCSGCAEPLR